MSLSLILVDECLAIWKALMMTIKKNSQHIIIESDTQLIVNAIHGKIYVPWDIIFVEVIGNICSIFKEVSIGYFARECDKWVDKVTKSVHKQLMWLSFYCLLF